MRISVIADTASSLTKSSFKFSHVNDEFSLFAEVKGNGMNGFC